MICPIYGDNTSKSCVRCASCVWVHHVCKPPVWSSSTDTRHSMITIWANIRADRSLIWCSCTLGNVLKQRNPVINHWATCGRVCDTGVSRCLRGTEPVCTDLSPHWFLKWCMSASVKVSANLNCMCGWHAKEYSTTLLLNYTPRPTDLMMAISMSTVSDIIVNHELSHVPTQY